MEHYKRFYFSSLIICLSLGALLPACDEKLEATEPELTAEEMLLVNEWQYSYIVINQDTIRDLYYSGEPTTDDEIDTPIGLRYLKYNEDHSYELRSEDLNFIGMGEGEGYQPNYGFWDLRSVGDSLILFHNQAINYEVQYYIIQLTNEDMIRKWIGDRPTVVYKDLDTGLIEEIKATTWIEVFQVRPSDED